MINANQKRLFTLGELFERPIEEIDFLVESVLIKGGLSLMAGKPKAGKSTLARVLALAVAKGEAFLDFPTYQGSVLYYALEEIQSEVRRHFMEMGAEGSESIVITTEQMPNALAAIASDIESVKPALVIIDPIFRFLKVRESNSYTEVTNAIDPLLQLARMANVHILCIHHLKKGGSGADAILGSTAIRGSFDVNILLNYNDGRRTIKSENRYGTPIDERELLFTNDKKCIILGEAAEDVTGLKIMASVIKYLSDTPIPRTEIEIRSSIIGKNEWKSYAIRKLLENQQILRTGSGKKGDPYKYSNSITQAP